MIKKKTKRKKNAKLIGWIIAVMIISLGVGGVIGWSMLSKEHEEARNLPLNGVDFDRLNDGTYIGEYEGGMYKWRSNKVQVIVTSGKVTNIKLLRSKESNEEKINQSILYDRVIEAQSLQVDTISGATLTSKAYLQGVENALKQAQK